MDFDAILRSNPGYVDDLYRRYQADRDCVGEDWANFFAGFEFAASERTLPGRAQQTTGVLNLIHSYREFGHLIANLDPLGEAPDEHPFLQLEQFGFSDADSGRRVLCPTPRGELEASVSDIVDLLRATYCGTMGAEYMYIDDAEQRRWLQDAMEPSLNQPDLSAADQLHILHKLTAATGFEQFLHTKYVGQKRFSLEGGEALIPLVDAIIDESASAGVSEIVVGMPHRGRLNLMANILGKPFEMIFSEFEGNFLPGDISGAGDVKYHLGYAHDHTTRDGRSVHISLLPNPSHLEAVDPVVEGIVRAKQRHLKDSSCDRVMPLLLHGDAAFTGQGTVAETLALSELPAYDTGGTIHVIVNNRIGFTAAPGDYCFARYPSDIAKFIQAPVFHVNGNDPEAAVHAARLAARFRHRFKIDVIIDLICYRLHGHNEADDPTFTQPRMYQSIREQKPVRDLYAEHLMRASVLDEAQLQEIRSEQRELFEAALIYARDFMPRQRIFALGGLWDGMCWAGSDRSATTAVDQDTLRHIADRARQVPAGFQVHPKAKRLIDARVTMLAEGSAIDWGCAEMLALGSLLLGGVNVRLTGQDSERGTFSHRHAVLTDQDSGKRHVPLQHLIDDQGWFTVADTMLSEAAALGFEYGFSSADPRNLVIWEAQFGDFANGAQVAIDQFIASSESKWQRMSGLVMLLPHGYEGQGPEHSSARLERFLQLSADDNLQVCNLTTPAQYFHALRRQQLRSFRKPLVLMSPKSLLRLTAARSSLRDLSADRFHPLLTDATAGRATRRALLCSGKLYYELVREREERDIDNIAILRVEELYPFPASEIRAALEPMPGDTEVAWVQEEPWNMGAWPFISMRLPRLLARPQELRYFGREEAASPASGSYQEHQREQSALIDRALKLP